MKKIDTLFLAVLLSSSFNVAANESTMNLNGPSKNGTNNQYIAAVAWKQTAAEYRALYYQGYTLAKLRVQDALKTRKKGDKPLAIVTDLDDTVLLPLAYWSILMKQGKDFFDDPTWDAWVPLNQMTLAPGAADFFKFCEKNNVEVFYVTSRNQGKPTYEIAMSNIRHAKLPNADTDHLVVLSDTSNKEKPQSKIEKTHNIIAFLGDNLNDFSRKFYSSNTEERLSLMEEEKHQFGKRYIIFPNPTDGHWLKAIFGDSEPPASDKNRKIFLESTIKVLSK
ncbi:5'-nucleotidase, lipoprotein e(P4) family [Spartinivicinus ruber]|uniref:5'-nucleotidase, lipoprotein e(P4) family n=1 Tax=Spartinivicinus ruber TaxID=2683272 RepID=UPI0013D55767|nr:5'-nucleotidase, lipoprotein e(P4) family [Spartinivicinus ruber]